MPWNPSSPGLRRLIELRQAFADEREVVLGSFFIQHQASPSGSLTTHVLSPGERIRLPSKDAADLVKRGFGDYPPGL